MISGMSTASAASLQTTALALVWKGFLMRSSQTWENSCFLPETAEKASRTCFNSFVMSASDDQTVWYPDCGGMEFVISKL